MIKFLFNKIRRYKLVRDYHGDMTWETSKGTATRLHIRNSILHSIWSMLLVFIHPAFVHAYFLAFLFYSPLNEMYFQYYKEKNKKLPGVLSQVIERASGFVLLSPLWILIYVLVRYFNFYLFSLF